jgi:co-chaperonin GroES (HSP10)
MKIKGKILPLRNNVFVSDMDFDIQRTKSGLFIPSDNGKTSGIHPRWGKVWAVGPEQADVKVGDWVLVEHGRWTRTVEAEQEDGSFLELRMIDADAILVISDERPEDVMRSS